ncbi:MAG TPA: hypothetical protein VMY35_09155, partial [Phycisphaerae bacterium]|nr:hypothetical protein [Phycisphaerae bacterium]
MEEILRQRQSGTMPGREVSPTTQIAPRQTRLESILAQRRAIRTTEQPAAPAPAPTGQGAEGETPAAANIGGDYLRDPQAWEQREMRRAKGLAPTTPQAAPVAAPEATPAPTGQGEEGETPAPAALPPRIAWGPGEKERIRQWVEAPAAEVAEGIPAILQNTGPTFRATWASKKAAGKEPAWAEVLAETWPKADENEQRRLAQTVLSREREGQLDLPTESGPRVATARELEMLQGVRGLSPADEIRREKVVRASEGFTLDYAAKSLQYLGRRAANAATLGVLGRLVPGLHEAVRREELVQPEAGATEIMQATGEVAEMGAYLKTIGAIFGLVARTSPWAAKVVDKIPGLRRVGPGALRVIRWAELKERFPASAKLIEVGVRKGAIGVGAAVPITAAHAVAQDMTWEQAGKQWAINTVFLGGISAAFGVAGQIDAFRYASKVKAEIHKVYVVRQRQLLDQMNRTTKHAEIATGKPFIRNPVKDLQLETIGPGGERVPEFLRIGPPKHGLFAATPEGKAYEAAHRYLYHNFQTAMRMALADEQIAGLQGRMEAAVRKDWIPGRPAQTPHEMAMKILREGVPPVRAPAEPGRPAPLAQVPAKPAAVARARILAGRAAKTVAPSAESLAAAARAAEAMAARGATPAQQIDAAAAALSRSVRQTGAVLSPEDARTTAERLVAEKQRQGREAAPAEVPALDQALAATRKSVSKLAKAKRTPAAIRKVAEKVAAKFGVEVDAVLQGMGAAAVQPTPPAAVSPVAEPYAMGKDVVSEQPAAAEVAPPKTRADIQRDLALWRQYQETGDESLLEDMTPGTVVDVSKEVATMSLDLAAGLKTIGERRAFWNRIEQAAELVESGEATKGELGAELAAYQAIWGKTDPLPSTLLERLGFPELITEPAAAEAVPAPGAVVPEVGIAPPAAPAKEPWKQVWEMPYNEFDGPATGPS